MNKLNKFTSLLLIFTLFGCDNATSSLISNISSSSFTPSNDVERIFYKLKDNNYTIDFYDSLYDLGNKERNSKYYYTEYSLEAEGDFGFSGIAQGDELIFKYNIVDNEIVSGTPIINTTNGTRYENVFDYTYGLQDLDVTKLPSKLESDGYYHYNFGENPHNDKIIMPVILRQNPYSIPPEELKYKIVKDTITFEAVILSYDFDGDKIPEGQSTITAIVYDIGKTENEEIKKYLEDGKTSKTPLDLRFYKLFHPYMSTTNYTVDLDASGMNHNFKMTEYCTDTAILDVVNNYKSGYMLNQGVVTSFDIRNEKVQITSTPTDSDYNFLTSLYGGVLSYCFLDITYESLIGYKDDTLDNVYYLTDSYLIYILGYLSYAEIYEENYCDQVKIEIIDDSKNEFIAYFDFYNQQTNEDLGTYTAHFYDLNNTVIKEVNDYLSYGDDPKTQSKENLENVLNMFKNNNYSCDVLTSAGLAKFYNTENYFYEELYGNPNSNFGYMKVNDSIYQFSVRHKEVILDTSKDYALGNNPLSIPSVGSFFGDTLDMGYVSSLNDGLYNLSNYTLSNNYNVDYWKLNDLTVASDVYKYFTGNPNGFLSNGNGLIVKDAGKDSKLTFFVSYVSSDGSYSGYTTFTYYDIGYTSNELLDNYVASL